MRVDRQGLARSVVRNEYPQWLPALVMGSTSRTKTVGTVLFFSLSRLQLNLTCACACDVDFVRCS
jgi:hypothetical protein